MVAYQPLEPQEWKPVQIITATYPNGGGFETEGEWGAFRVSNVVDALEHILTLHGLGTVWYSMHEGAKLVDATDGRLWTAHYWNGRVSKYVFTKNVKVFPLPVDNFSFEECWPFFDWVKSLGVSPGSFTSMSQRVWRASLTRRIDFFDEGKEGRNCLYGNRKEAIRGQYEHVRYQDLSSAFPSTMADNSYPRTTKESSKREIFPGGYCLATVKIPKGLPWGPVPCRLGKKAVTYGWGEQTDWWMSEDLQHVINVGGAVAIHRSFRPFDTRPVFHSWYHDLILPARNSMERDSQLLVKRMANRLWSSFAVGGSSKVARWTEDNRRRVVERTTELRGMLHVTFIAAQTTALVRSRVFDALYKMRDPVYVDTDGIICREMEDFGDGWRIKRRMRTCWVHSPGNHKWECYKCGVIDCGGPHYSISVPTRSTKQKEILLKREEMPVNPLFGVTVPPVESLSAMRKRFRYEEPTAPRSDEVRWIRQDQESWEQEKLT